MFFILSQYYDLCVRICERKCLVINGVKTRFSQCLFQLAELESVNRNVLVAYWRICHSSPAEYCTWNVRHTGYCKPFCGFQRRTPFILR